MLATADFRMYGTAAITFTHVYFEGAMYKGHRVSTKGALAAAALSDCLSGNFTVALRPLDFRRIGAVAMGGPLAVADFLVMLFVAVGIASLTTLD